ADEELVRVAEAQLQRAKEELQISVNKFQAGAATRSDTLTARVDFGNAQLALLQANANLATAQANLGRQVGVDQPVRAVPDTAFPSLPDTTALRAQALDSSPQVQQAEARARAAGAQVGAARSQYWPTLSASYANGYTGLDSLGRLGLAPWSTTQRYVNNWALRFSLSWTLFNGFTREANQVTVSVAQDVARAAAADTRRQVGAQLTQQLAAARHRHPHAQAHARLRHGRRGGARAARRRDPDATQRVRGHHGPLGLREIDVDEPHRVPRHPHRGRILAQRATGERLVRRRIGADS